MTTPPKPLTNTQRHVLNYLRAFLLANHTIPTSAQIASAFGWSSPNAANSHLKYLEKKGHLRRNEVGGYMLAERVDMAFASMETPTK